MPQRVRMFLEGLVRQPGNATSTVATPVGCLVLTQGELMELAIYLGGNDEHEEQLIDEVLIDARWRDGSALAIRG